MIDGWNSIDSQDFEVGGAIGFTYDPNPALSLRSGFAINPGTTGVPVMPLLSLRWRFADDWTLNFGFPRTSIDYQLNSKLRLSPLKLDFEGGTFHTNSVYGNSVGAPILTTARSTTAKSASARRPITPS